MHLETQNMLTLDRNSLFFPAIGHDGSEPRAELLGAEEEILKERSRCLGKTCPN